MLLPSNNSGIRFSIFPRNLELKVSEFQKNIIEMINAQIPVYPEYQLSQPLLCYHVKQKLRKMKTELKTRINDFSLCEKLNIQRRE